MFNNEIISKTKSPPHLKEIVLAKVLSVYDGDTCTVAYNINDNSLTPFIINVRLLGIDAPEKRTTNDLEKAASLLITECISDMILDKIVQLDIHGWDKFGGRIVGNIKLPDMQENISEWLLNRKLVKSFDGKNKKKEWTDQELEDIINFLNK